MAKYENIRSGQTKTMTKDEYKSLPEVIQKRWSEIPSKKKKTTPPEADEQTD